MCGTPSGVAIFGVMPGGTWWIITVHHRSPYFSDVAVQIAPRIVTQYKATWNSYRHECSDRDSWVIKVPDLVLNFRRVLEICLSLLLPDFLWNQSRIQRVDWNFFLRWLNDWNLRVVLHFYLITKLWFKPSLLLRQNTSLWYDITSVWVMFVCTFNLQQTTDKTRRLLSEQLSTDVLVHP